MKDLTRKTALEVVKDWDGLDEATLEDVIDKEIMEKMYLDPKHSDMLTTLFLTRYKVRHFIDSAVYGQSFESIEAPTRAIGIVTSFWDTVEHKVNPMCKQTYGRELVKFIPDLNQEKKYLLINTIWVAMLKMASKHGTESIKRTAEAEAYRFVI